MRRKMFTTAALMAVLTGTPAAAQDTDLNGAWVITGVTDASGASYDAQPGLFLFTDTHYSIMYVPGSERRSLFSGQQPTEADLIKAYNSFIANSGRYDLNGNEITFRAYVAKDPGYMDAWPENGLTARVEREGETLKWTFTGQSFFSGTVFTMQRPE